MISITLRVHYTISEGRHYRRQDRIANEMFEKATYTACICIAFVLYLVANVSSIYGLSILDSPFDILSRVFTQ
jgi:hypothetical protein